MSDRVLTPAAQRVPLPAMSVLIVFVYGCAMYANLSFAVRRSADYAFFPPFQPHVNANDNAGLAGENFNIAQSLVAGQGFAHPFNAPTGPTAWMPPVLPLIEAALLWICGTRAAVMAVIVLVQMTMLIATGLLVLKLARSTTRQLGTGAALTVVLVQFLAHFHFCFQETQDCWLVLLAIDLLLAGSCLWQPLVSTRAAAGWGLCGGLCALVNPILGLTWAMLSLLLGPRWSRLAIAGLVAGLVVMPWVVRNYVVFGRLIPIKANLAYELYQSQCMQPDGVIHPRVFKEHPYTLTTPEGRVYRQLGETAYLRQKGEQFWQAVAAAPVDFLRRLGNRFLAATLWYVPSARAEGIEPPVLLWLNRVLHPLPFLALLVLALAAWRWRLSRVQMITIVIYVCYLLPYVVISYYERYAVPLLGVKALLVLWAADRLLARSDRETKSGCAIRQQQRVCA